ncbi:TetR/AcrR family transcriptional regulator C-terminal domain-containing protein [Streptomyces atroolivaceus]|uniref:TetR/AcrR family transcriptional regulator C-terminal domain-containing protein n=1 Tax=Streptomyces atroolivaceus TaxID=66869 RepID=UPI0024E11092|nr:TetR/AcrR family transcriptional regulator C-terminal domain-containing protein [Streptomyces atroolivaceus]
MAEEAAGFLPGASTAARRHRPEPDWRTTATSMATDLYEMFLRHPWLVQAFAAHVLYGENKARHDAHGLLQALLDGLSGKQSQRQLQVTGVRPVRRTRWAGRFDAQLTDYGAQSHLL